MPIVQCAICEMPIQRKSSSIKHNFCSRRCFDKGRHLVRERTGNVIKCESCGKQVYKSKSQIENHSHHFCSVDCANTYQRRTKIEYTCKTCRVLFYLSPSLALAKNRNPTYCSIACRNNDLEWREKTTRSRMKKISERRPNGLELSGRAILESIGMRFQEQVLIADKFLVDVLLPNERIIIHWDGEYWHGHPRFEPLTDRQIKRKTLDKSQDLYSKKCGYRTLRFWESTTHNLPFIVEQTIRQEMALAI